VVVVVGGKVVVVVVVGDEVVVVVVVGDEVVVGAGDPGMPVLVGGGEAEGGAAVETKGATLVELPPAAVTIVGGTAETGVGLPASSWEDDRASRRRIPASDAWRPSSCCRRPITPWCNDSSRTAELESINTSDDVLLEYEIAPALAPTTAASASSPLDSDPSGVIAPPMEEQAPLALGWESDKGS
jgi:hypothetical protein